MRCFIAVDVPAPVRAAVARVQATLRAAAPQADVRWTSPEAMHLTLKFLGAVPDACVPAVSAALDEALAGRPVVDLHAGGLGTFPGPARPRVVWAGLTAGADGLRALAARVEGGLAALGFAPEARPFRCHLTLGRVRSPRGGRDLTRAIEAADASSLGTWTADAVVLYESRLRPTGAEYRAVSRHPLGARDT